MRWERYNFRGKTHLCWILAEGTCLGAIDPDTFGWCVFMEGLTLPLPVQPRTRVSQENCDSLYRAERRVISEALPFTPPRIEATDITDYLELMWDAEDSGPGELLTFYPVVDHGRLYVNGARLEHGQKIIVKRTAKMMMLFAEPGDKPITDYLHGTYVLKPTHYPGDHWSRHVIELHEGLYGGSIDAQIIQPEEVEIHLCN